MDLDKALGILLDADTDVVAIAGANVYSEELPQSKESGGAQVQPYPGLSYREPADFNKRTIDTLEGGCTLVEETRDFFSAAKNKTVAKALSNAVFNLLHEFSGTVSDDASPPNTIEIQGIFADISNAYLGKDHATGVYHYLNRLQIKYSVFELNKNSEA